MACDATPITTTDTSLASVGFSNATYVWTLKNFGLLFDGDGASYRSKVFAAAERQEEREWALMAR